MTLHMIEPSEPIRTEFVVIHVFADPGVGRTTLANTGEKVLLADYDNGVHRSLGRQRAARMDAWEDMEDLLKHPHFAECQTFAIDTVGRALELLTHSILVGPEGSKAGSLSMGLNQHGWGILRTRFTQFFSELRRHRKHVLMLSHAKIDRDRNGNKTAVPDIQGGSAGEVFKVSDAMAYMEVREGKRILDFNITDFHLGKNPAAWGPLVVPDYSKAPRFMSESIIVPLINHLNTLSEEQTKVIAEVSDWQGKIEALDPDPQAFTDTIQSVSKIKHPATSAQVKTLLWRRATKVLGFEFDKEKGSFVKPKAKKEKTEAVAAV